MREQNRNSDESPPRDRWCAGFFDMASTWWPRADTNELDRQRARLLREIAAPGARSLLEIGCGDGSSAAAAATAGFDVTAVDVSGTRISAAQELAASAMARDARLRFVCGDIYTVTLEAPFDVVCYWNGFGVGSDDDQRFLLHRVATELLRPGGMLVLDVYAPWRWASIHGHREVYSSIVCDSEFDPLTSTFIERWWHRDEPGTVISQYGRCYSPQDFILLIGGLDLELVDIRPGCFRVDSVDSTKDMASMLLESWDYTVILQR